ncbi:LysR substrate-binding domain-containing protein [Arthrobacter sp. YN]|uniref:LysR substrate-binding domain-containing protein n=1 Tax=Arthrobacter sp. YN TaxID=2020486 RepID=UPI000B604E0F|nr:LysR substrate-binding domain-containing protein [Arthrobacter sp. YN]ASN20058.1 LysR family transcriptional regulator [Arthrobacter sp. YN]
MEIRQLNYFIAVAEERHFGRAAKRLHMAQPPLSQQIRQLEEQLGVRLLNRTTRRVELTAAGQALLDRGRQIVNAVGTLRADVYQVGQGASGVLRVGFSGSATYGVMPPIVRRAKQVLPGLSLNLHGEMLTPAMEAGLRDGTLDAALLRPPIASQDIEYRIVTREPLILALPSFSALAMDRPVAVHELQDQEFISYPPESVLYRVTAGLCREAGFQPRITQVISETSTMLSFVAAGSGVAILPASVRALQLEGVVYRDIEQAPEVDLAVAWRREDRSSLLQSFLDVVGAATKDLPNRTPSPSGS